MWHQVGFLADAFAVFKEHGLSVDLVSTSETNVTVSLDPAANTLDGAAARRAGGRSVAAVSRAGDRALREPQPGRPQHPRASCIASATRFELFEEQKIHLVSQAANDLNFTFVDRRGPGRATGRSSCTTLLIRASARDDVLGPTWQQLFAPAARVRTQRAPWWRAKRDRLLAARTRARGRLRLRPRDDPCRASKRCAGLQSIDRVLLLDEGQSARRSPAPRWSPAGVGFECVSQGELEHVLDALSGARA